MTIEELNSRIAVINAESNRINNERRVNIGKKETLNDQLTKALAQYNSTYGTNVTVETLQAEIARVCAEKEQEVTAIETMLNLIKSGNFAEAEKIASGNIEQTTVEQSTTSVTEQVQTPVTPAVESVVTPVVPVIEQPVVTPVAPVIEQPVAPVVEEVKTAGVVTQQPFTHPKSQLSGLDIPTPPSLGTPVASSMPTPPSPSIPTPPPALSGLNVTPVAPPPTAKQPSSFGAILGGSAYNPQ